jgi:hypothetical protein
MSTMEIPSPQFTSTRCNNFTCEMLMPAVSASTCTASVLPACLSPATLASTPRNPTAAANAAGVGGFRSCAAAVAVRVAAVVVRVAPIVVRVAPVVVRVAAGGGQWTAPAQSTVNTLCKHSRGGWVPLMQRVLVYGVCNTHKLN